MLMGLVAAAVLAQGDMVKSIAMVVVGLLLGIVGTDVNTGTQRFSFGIFELTDGIGFIVVAVGVFAVGEIIANLGDKSAAPGALRQGVEPVPDVAGPEAVVRADRARHRHRLLLRRAAGHRPGDRIVLLLHGGEEDRRRTPTASARVRSRAWPGPEAANNADAQCKFIPMLTLGLPASGVMALMLGALTIQGIQPGPQVMTQRPELFWGLIASMWIGNLMLVVLNLPLIGLWVKLLQVPYRLLFPAIMAFSAIGIFSVNNSSFEIHLTALFGVFGFIWMRLGFPLAPMLLGFVLGPMMEEYLRRAMLMSGGDPSVFITRPLSAVFIIATILILVVMIAPAVRKRREAFTD